MRGEAIKHRKNVVLALAGATVLYSNPAFAQDIDLIESADDADIVIVTAQRREQALIDVPISVTVIGGDRLSEEGITSTAELVGLVPNLAFADGGTRSYTRPIIRGVGDGINNGTDANVGVYIDDVPLPTFLADFDLLDVERVEVLRGPQGTLFGQNSLAGAINIITREASDEFEGAAEVGYGTFEDFNVQAYVSGPITDRLRAKVAVRYNDFGGFVENTATGGKVDPHENIGFRGILSYDVTDKLTVNLIGDYAEDDGSYLDGVLFGELSKFEPDGNFSIRDTYGGAMTVNYDGDAFNLISITAYREFTNNDFLTSAGFENRFMNEQDQWTQEIRISSGVGEWLDWVAGVYYYDENFTQSQSNDFFPVVSIGFDGEVDTKTYAGFGDATISVTPKVDISGGLRYTYIEKEGDIDTSLFVFTPPAQVFDNGGEIDFEQLSARASVLYRLTPKISAFASFANGFKPGAFSFYSTQSNDPPVTEENGRSYELGVRGSAADGRITFDVTGFILKYEDRITLEDVPGTMGAVTRLTNAGEATSRGLEAAFVGSVTENFTVTAAYAFLDTEFDEFVTTSANLSGNRFAFAPEHTLTLGWDFEAPITERLSGFIRGNWRYFDDQFMDDENTLIQESYSLTRLSVGVEFENLIVSVDANNLFDRYYTVNQSQPAGFPVLVTPGLPRQVMGRVRVRF